MSKKKPTGRPNTNAGSAQGKRLIQSMTSFRDRLKREDASKQPSVPSWVCPKCGTAHPITVTECCKPVPMVTHVWPFSPATEPNPVISRWYHSDTGCLHDNCSGCKNGTCNGVHMISCPCPKCSPGC